MLILSVIEVIGPVLIVAGSGFAWARSGRAWDSRGMTALLMNLAIPALFLSAFSSLDLPAGIIFRFMAATVLAHVLFAAAGTVILRLAGLPVRVYLSSFIFGNAGNLGLPVCTLAFGEEGLVFALAFMAVNAVGLCTVGVMLPCGHCRGGEVARMPIIWAIAASLLMLATGLGLPTILERAAGILGQIAVPLMLLSLGVGLARLRPSNLVRSFVLSLAKFAVAAGVGLGLAWLFDLGPVASGVFIVQCLMPVAVITYLFAERYDSSPGDVAGFVLVSTLAAIPVLTVALGLLM